jgi:hypothetical protein
MGGLHFFAAHQNKDSRMRQLSTLRAATWRLAIPAALALLASTQAQAVPSFARQTGQDCAACHVGAFGPQLTPYGVKFKLGGYVDGNGKGNVPLSGMVVLDSSKYKVLNENTEQYDSKRKTGLAEASLFLAGKLADHVGSFVQVTNSGIEHHTGIDQADVRATGTTNLGEHEALIGVSVNNNPTVQDPFNTLNVWSFPYTGSDRLSYPGADLQSASVEQRVIGINAYTLIDDSFYGELGTYNSISPSMQSRLGSGRYQDPTAVPLNAYPSLSNAPYWRLGYMQDLRTRAWNVGLLGFSGTIKDRLDTSLSTKFNDMGIDGGYQFLGTREHVVTVNGSYMREKVTDTLNSEGKYTSKNLKLATSYHYLNTYGATVGYFKGSYSGDVKGGNSGALYQVDYTPWGKENSWYAPWANVRLGLQYVRFNTSSDIDTSLGQKVSDLNSLRLFAWTSF